MSEKTVHLSFQFSINVSLCKSRECKPEIKAHTFPNSSQKDTELVPQFSIIQVFRLGLSLLQKRKPPGLLRGPLEFPNPVDLSRNPYFESREGNPDLPSPLLFINLILPQAGLSSQSRIRGNETLIRRGAHYRKR